MQLYLQRTTVAVLPRFLDSRALNSDSLIVWQVVHTLSSSSNASLWTDSIDSSLERVTLLDIESDIESRTMKRPPGTTGQEGK